MDIIASHFQSMPSQTSEHDKTSDWGGISTNYVIIPKIMKMAGTSCYERITFNYNWFKPFSSLLLIEGAMIVRLGPVSNYQLSSGRLESHMGCYFWAQNAECLLSLSPYCSALWGKGECVYESVGLKNNTPWKFESLQKLYCSRWGIMN